MVDLADSLESMALRLAQWFDADDEDRLPVEVRYWCINEARKEIIRNNDLRWGNRKGSWLLIVGDYQDPFEGGDAEIDTWQKPLYIWYYDSVSEKAVYLDHIPMKEYDGLYPDPSTATFRGVPSKFATDGEYLWITPASEVQTLQIRYYGTPDDLEAGSGTNTDNFQQNAASAIFWTSMGYANDWFPSEEARDPIWETKKTLLIDELVMQENRNRTAGRLPVRKTPGHQKQG